MPNRDWAQLPQPTIVDHLTAAQYWIVVLVILVMLALICVIALQLARKRYVSKLLLIRVLIIVLSLAVIFFVLQVLVWFVV